MRKITLCFVLLLCVALVGCSKDEEEAKFSPIGYTYSSHDYLYTIFVGIEMYENYTFIDETKIRRSHAKKSPTGGIYGSPSVLTYKLNYPSLTIYDEEGKLYRQCKFISEKEFDFGEDYQYRRID